MKTLLILAACNLLAPLAIAASQFIDDAPSRFVHITEKDDDSKDKYDVYISASKIGVVTLHEEKGKFEVEIRTLTPGPSGGSMVYSADFPDRESAAKCVARILQIMNQAEKATDAQPKFE
jgi:hypothetical protein